MTVNKKVIRSVMEARRTFLHLGSVAELNPRFNRDAYFTKREGESRYIEWLVLRMDPYYGELSVYDGASYLCSFSPALVDEWIAAEDAERAKWKAELDASKVTP